MCGGCDHVLVVSRSAADYPQRCPWGCGLIDRDVFHPPQPPPPPSRPPTPFPLVGEPGSAYEDYVVPVRPTPPDEAASAEELRLAYIELSTYTDGALLQLHSDRQAVETHVTDQNWSLRHDAEQSHREAQVARAVIDDLQADLSSASLTADALSSDLTRRDDRITQLDAQIKDLQDAATPSRTSST